MEDHFSIKATQACLQDPKAAVSTAKDYSKQLLEIDSKLSLQRAEGHPSLKHILEVSKKISWMKVFDMALDHGTKGTRTVQSIMKMLSVPLYGHRECRHCGTNINPAVSYAEHLTVCSSCNASFNIPDVINALTTFSELLFFTTNELYHLK